MSNYIKMLIHQKGWMNGAGGQPMNTAYSESDDKTVAHIYEDGYVLGRVARRCAFDSSAAKFNVVVGEVHLQNPD